MADPVFGGDGSAVGMVGASCATGPGPSIVVNPSRPGAVSSVAVFTAPSPLGGCCLEREVLDAGALEGDGYSEATFTQPR